MNQAEITQRDWDEAIVSAMEPKWDGAGCHYCGSGDRCIDYGDGVRVPCPICNKLDQEEK